jgi:hypothetical protein
MELAKSKGLPIGTLTIHGILLGMLQSSYGHPEEIFDIMKKYSVSNSTIIMNYVLGIYAKINSDKIRPFYEEMAKNNHDIFYITKMDCINSSINQNDLVSFQHFEKLDSFPIIAKDYAIFARGYHHFNMPEQMRIFWNGILSQRILTDAYEYIIQCFIKHGDKPIELSPPKKYIDLVQSVWVRYYAQDSRSTRMCEIMMKYLLDYRSDPVACMALFEESMAFEIPPSPQHMTVLLKSPILSIDSKWRVFEGLKALHYPTVDDYVLMMRAERDLEKLAGLFEDFQSGDYVIDERVAEAIKPLTDQEETLRELVELQLKLVQNRDK